MALLPYLFVAIHTVKVCPMLLKIDHVLETYGTRKLEALEIGDLTPPSHFHDTISKKLDLHVEYKLKNLVRLNFRMLILEHSFLCLYGRSLLKDIGSKKTISEAP